MLLIADSGSTKTDWVFTNAAGDEPVFFKTKGLNPNVLDDVTLSEILNDIFLFIVDGGAVEEVFFYGAGCGSDANKLRLSELLSAIFPNAIIHVFADIDGAVNAVKGDEPAIVAILGTGSNSCFTDGENIYANDFSLGYILGDEGSGVYFGKRLLRDYFYKILPQELEKSFTETYGLTRDELIEKVYRTPAPNEFIASFLPFYHQHLEHPYCQYFIDFGLTEFLKIYILRFRDFKQLNVHFVGSVAQHFEGQLRTACEKLEIKVGKIIATPIVGLLEYHTKQ